MPKRICLSRKILGKMDRCGNWPKIGMVSDAKVERRGPTALDPARLSDSEFHSAATRAPVQRVNRDRTCECQNVEAARTLPAARLPLESGLRGIGRRLAGFCNSSVCAKRQKDAQDVFRGQPRLNRNRGFNGDGLHDREEIWNLVPLHLGHSPVSSMLTWGSKVFTVPQPSHIQRGARISVIADSNSSGVCGKGMCI